MEKKLSTLIFSAMIAMSVNAAEWQKPVPTKFADNMEIFQKGQQDTTFYYMYLKDEGFMCAGYKWGTQASVGLDGHKIYVSAAGAAFDGTNVVINNYFPAKNGWFEVFLMAADFACMNQTKEGNYYFGMQKEGTAYRFYQSELNETYKSEADTKLYLGLDKTLDANTARLTANIQLNSTYFVDYDIDWYLVPADYYEQTYKPQLDRYNAAMKLRQLIDDRKAKFPDADFSKFEAVYENTNSTLEELQTAINGIDAALFEVVLAGASETNPINVSKTLFDILDITYDFENRWDGWTTTTGATSVGAGNGNAAVDKDATGNHYENWKADAFSGKIFATAKNLPAGLYKVEGLFYAVQGSYSDVVATNNTYFFVNDRRALVNSTRIDATKPMTLSLTLSEPGDITYGLDITTVDKTNWVGMDNVTITYFGKSTADPDKILLEDAIKVAKAEFGDLESVHANKTVKKNFADVLAEVESATSDYAAAAEKLNNALGAIRTSVKDYEKLSECIDHAQEQQASLETIYPDLAGQIDDTIMEWQDQYNTTMEYTADDINGLMANLNKMIAQYISENIKVGDDITALIQNAGFDYKDNFSGWSYDRKPGWGGMDAATGGTMKDVEMTSGVSEYYKTNSSLSQILPSLPAGVYDLSCQGFVQEVNQNVMLFAQVPGIDEQRVALPHRDDYATAEQLYDGPFADTQNADGKWVPTGMPSSNRHFQHDEDGDGVNDYTVNLKVVLTEQTDSMKIGLRTVGKVTWSCFDNFRLVYKGQDLDSYKTICENLKSQIAAVRENASQRKGMGADADKMLTNAIAEADAANVVESYLKAIDDMKAAIAYATESVNLYEQLNNILDNLTANYVNAQVPEIKEQATNFIGEVSIAVDEKMYTNDEVKAKIAEAKPLIIALNIPGNYAEATETAPVDFTNVIPNHDLENDGEYYWIAEKPNGGNGPVLNNGINGKSMEFWTGDVANAKFNYYQSLGSLLPEGWYKLSASIANSYSDGLGTHYDHATTDGEIELYAQVAGKDYAKPVPTQTELCTDAHKTLEVLFHVDKNKDVIIGVKSFKQMTAQWVVMDDFTMTYLGMTASAGVDFTTADASQIKAIYDLQGRQMNTLKKGVNIITTKNGTTKKVIIR